MLGSGRIMQNQVQVIVIKTLGTYYYMNGDKLEGDWEDDKEPRNGIFYNENIGIYYYSNGDKYTGDIESRIRNGRGKMIYANGDVYDGDWVNDTKEGKGIFALD